MTNRNQARRAIVSALDSLTNGGEWQGNVREVYNELYKQGHSWVTDYMIRQVLRDYGQSLGRGQYRVTFKELFG